MTEKEQTNPRPETLHEKLIQRAAVEAFRKQVLEECKKKWREHGDDHMAGDCSCRTALDDLTKRVADL